MNLCSKNHEEICYEGKWCPLCDVLKEREELEKENERLKEENDNNTVSK